MPTPRDITDKQLLLLYVIANGTGDLSDYWLDLDQILDRLSVLGWAVSKASLQFSVRSLIGRGLIEKRKARRRAIWMRRTVATTRKGRIALNALTATGRARSVLDEFQQGRVT